MGKKNLNSRYFCSKYQKNCNWVTTIITKKIESSIIKLHALVEPSPVKLEKTSNWNVQSNTVKELSMPLTWRSK